MNTISRELGKIRFLILADFRVQMLFRLGILIQLLNVTIAAASYYFLTTLFHGSSEVMKRYSTDVVSYILLGLTMNPIFTTSLVGFISALETTYVSRALERIMMAPTSPYSLFFSRMANGYITSIIAALLYLVIGIAVFRVRLGTGNPLAVLLILLLGAIATIAVGMLLAQVFFYTYTGKGSGGSVVIFVQGFMSVFTGATFPIEVLPTPLRWISAMLPQTHAIRAARLVLAGRAIFDTVIIQDLLFLIGFCMVMLPVGVWLMRKGLEHMRKEGYSPQPRFATARRFG
ncbi:MAG TPA: ABC transporter permease [Pyrinomonadaceae bacterium]|jgi:ABC-2 type transport system permease protein